MLILTVWKKRFHTKLFSTPDYTLLPEIPTRIYVFKIISLYS